MKPMLDLNKEYGLVLEGGGARGAYQIGVWKALLEFGVKIKGIAGVSVGALNGALFCMGDYLKAEELWSSITYSNIMNVNEEQIRKLKNKDLKNIDIKELLKDIKQFVTDRGINITPLKNLINEYVDEDKIRNSDIEFLVGTFEVSKLKGVEIVAKETKENALKDYLLASSYLPAFQNEKLQGIKYLDGGLSNNVPVDMLINRGYKDIIIIRIYGLGLEKPIKIPKDVNIIEIAPKANLGGILEFDSRKSKRNIKLGYYDAVKQMCSLRGKIYYIDGLLSEEECLNNLIHVNNYAKMALLEYYKLNYEDLDIYTRLFLETVCPRLAATLKLKKEWTYQELYISLLELCAKAVMITKYKVYTEEQLLELVKIRYHRLKENGYRFPIFVELVLKMITIA